MLIAAKAGGVMTPRKQAELARRASLRLLSLPGALKTQALLNMADRLSAHSETVLRENSRDLADAEGLSPALFKRLELNEEKINQMVKSVREVANLPEPVGRKTAATELDSGLTLYRVTAPIGVIGVIFESRPDALVQISSLCIKSGNAVILKGGSEASRSNRILHRLITEALLDTDGMFSDSVQLVTTREQVGEILKLDDLIDLMIPRGSSEMVRSIQENTRIPVLGHAEGVCHIFVDREADLEMALEITRDAKCQYPAVCNALETLLVHAGIAERFIRELPSRIPEVELRGDPASRRFAEMKPATDQDWRTEYGDLILSVRVVPSLESAVEHINLYGSRHTDAIVSSSRLSAEVFLETVDSGSVLWNCSTRLADGYRFGLGAEVGIATGKLHARGPVGLDGLTTYKYKLYGSGQTVGSYVDGSREFHHRRLDPDIQ